MANPVHTVPFPAMAYDGSLAEAKQAAKEFAKVLHDNCYDVNIVVSTTNQECLVMWCRTISSQILHDYTRQVQVVTNTYKEKRKNGGLIDHEC